MAVTWDKEKKITDKVVANLQGWPEDPDSARPCF